MAHSLPSSLLHILLSYGPFGDNSTLSSFSNTFFPLKTRRSINSSENSTNGKVLNKEGLRNAAIMCPICIEEINPMDMAMKCSNNGHFFHQKCLSDWMVFQTTQNQENRREEGGQSIAGLTTCPYCRDALQEKAARLKTYLEDPMYSKDDRGVFEKMKLKLRLYFSVFLTDRQTISRFVASVVVFLFGLLKGVTMSQWTFAQDVLYFTLPYKLRVITSIGYLLGLIIRVTGVVVASIRKHGHIHDLSRNLSR